MEIDAVAVVEIADDLNFVDGDDVGDGRGGVRGATAERDKVAVAEIANDHLESVGGGDVGNGASGVRLRRRW